MLAIFPLLKQLWSVWFTLVFTGIVLWAWWPSRRASLQAQALIPLRDDPPVVGRSARREI
jgi:cytochrome c oxidase cbb3-type subunit 4